MISAVAKVKVNYLTSIPWLLCRATTPEVAKECLAQFDSADARHHEQLSIQVLSFGTPTRRELEQLAAWAGEGEPPLGPNLGRVVDMMCCIPFDDTRAEGPHASLSRAASNTRASSWAWDAATTRLKQNFVHYDELMTATGANTQLLWNAWSKIVKNSGRMSRGLRKRKKEIIKRVYTIVSAPGFGYGFGEEDFIDDDAELPGDDDKKIKPYEKELFSVLSTTAQRLMSSYLEVGPGPPTVGKPPNITHTMLS